MYKVQENAISAVLAAGGHDGETIAEYAARSGQQIITVRIGSRKVAGTPEEIIAFCGPMKIMRYHDDFVSVFTR